MAQVEIFIPAFSNDGVRFNAAHHALFEVRLAEAFPAGSTRLPGTFHGQWTAADGAVYRDRGRVYSASVPGVLLVAVAVLDLAAFARVHYGQLAIFVRYTAGGDALA